MNDLCFYNGDIEFLQDLIDNSINSGYHNVTWDAADMSAGLYIYTLQAKGISLSNKMILMK